MSYSGKGLLCALTVVLFGSSDGRTSDLSSAASPAGTVMAQASGKATGPCAGPQSPKASMGKCQIGAEAVIFYYTDDEASWRNLCLEAKGAWLGK